MIAIFTGTCNRDSQISQENYDQLVSQVQIHRLSCRSGHKGSFQRYGYYRRSVRVDGEKVSLRICRVICTVCGRTHALLPDWLVPYSQIPLEDQKDIIAASERGQSPGIVLERNCLIDEREVRSLVRKYRKHWKERLAAIALSVEAPELLMRCINSFSRQFMQIRKSWIGIYLLPT